MERRERRSGVVRSALREPVLVLVLIEGVFWQEGKQHVQRFSCQRAICWRAVHHGGVWPYEATLLCPCFVQVRWDGP